MDTLLQRRRLMEAQTQGLPSGYTEARYLNCGGSEYFDSLLTPDENYEIEAKFYRRSTTTCYLYGVASSGNSASYTAYIKSGGGNWRFSNGAVTVTVGQNTTNTTTQNSSGVTVNGTLQAYSNITGATAPGTLIIASYRAAAGTVGSSCYYGYIYYIKVRKNGNLIADFIPAKNASDVFGMYDLVRRRWFPSESGTPFSGTL